MKRLNFASPDAQTRGRSKEPLERATSTTDLRELLRELDSSLHQQLSLFKMLAVKSSEADSSFKRVRAHLAKGDVTLAEKLLGHLESANANTLREV